MSAPQLAPGQIVAGRLSIVAPLRVDGASAVYRASDQGRDVVVRLLHPAFASRPDIMQGLRAIQAHASALPPDALVPIWHVDVDPALSAPYVLTELVTDPSLAQIAHRERLGMDRVALLLSSLARSLDAAHQRQLLHGALRPTKVFVGPSGAARVSDFTAGMLLRAMPTPEDWARAAPWLAPEQMREGSGTPGPATDVFACALLAFFAMTGRSYWRSCQGASPDVSMLSREVVAPRTAASVRANELGAAIAPALDSILARALSVDPAARFQSVGELAAAVTAALKPLETSSATVALPASAFEPPAAPPAPAPPPAAAPQMAPPGGGMPANPWAAAPAQTAEAAPPKKSNVGLVVGAAAAFVLVGGAFAFWMLLRSSGDAQPTTASSATAPPAASSAPATVAPEADAGAAPPEPTSEPVADAGPEKPAEVALTVRCNAGACDTVRVDDKPVADPTGSVTVAPGAHKVAVTKAGFLPANQNVEATPPAMEIDITMTPVVTTSGKGTGSPKPCGKFLKRCD